MSESIKFLKETGAQKYEYEKLYACVCLKFVFP